MRIGERIHYMLTVAGSSQAELADYLNTSRSTVHGWKQENRNPSAELIMPICEFLETTPEYLLTGQINHARAQQIPKDIFEIDKLEKVLIENYRKLDHQGQIEVQHTAYQELSRVEGRTQDANNNVIQLDAISTHIKGDLPPDRKEIAVFFQPAAAGTGTFLDSDDYDMVDVPIDPITIRASFGVRVSGDSMEPEYEDEDIVFVKQQPTLESGLIGVFVLNGDAYIKKLMKVKNKYQLISLNSKYKPIDIHANDEFRVVGKVIGKFDE